MDETDRTSEDTSAQGPSPEVTHRHRAQLHEAIDAERRRPLRADRPADQPGRRRVRLRAVTVGVAVVAIAALIGVTIATGSRDTTHQSPGVQAANSDTSADTTSGTTGSSSTSTQACTTSPPQQLVAPAGFANPAAVSDPDAPKVASSAQRATTWQSSTGSLETRWPADETQPAVGGALSGTTPDGNMTAVATAPTTTSSGLTAQTLLFYFPNLPGGCNTLQATVYDRDPTRVAALIQQLAATPFAATTPTVTAHTSAAVSPAVATCEAPAGITPPANRTAVVRTNAYATPDDALKAFLATSPSLFRDGYTQIALADGTIAYTREIRPGVVVTSVHATPANGGWAISDWNASGC